MRPNRHTIGLFAVLLAMWYAGASQNNAAAYLLGFLTLSVSAVSAVHGWSNLRGLQLTAEPISPVYEEEPIVIFLDARAEKGRRHVAVRIVAKEGTAQVVIDEISSSNAARVELLVPARARGRYDSLDVLVTSTFPLGFFTARRVIRLRQTFHVYPRPVGAIPLPAELLQSREAQVGMQSEGDDFAGVRDWQAGESMRHVDWKAVARGQRMMVKQWSGTARDPLTFRWDQLGDLETEDRLRQLARWVVLAERLESPYGLKLPGIDVPLSRGDSHFHRSLRVLAEFRG